MLLDRRRIKKWQKVIYSFMAVLMVAFLIYIPVGTNGCGGGTPQVSQNDRITKLQQQLKASPGNAELLRSLGEAHVIAAQEAGQGTAQWELDLARAAEYFEKYDVALAAEEDLDSVAARIDNLEQLGGVYNQLGDAQKVVGVYARLVELQPDNADVFAYYGLAALNSGQTNVALLAFKKYLEMAPDGEFAADIRARIKELTATASPSPSPSASPSGDGQ